MQIEIVTAPPAEQPAHLRYASLHRAVERGLASDEVWKDLARVSLELGLAEEALRACRNMAESPARRALEAELNRRGLALPQPSAPSPVRAVQPLVPPRSGHPGLHAHLVDSAEYLLQAHLPATLLIAILSFPLVVGLGGFLTAGGSAFLLPAIAFLPGLCVLGVVGALARRILVDSANGEELPPAIPDLRNLAADCIAFLRDAACLVGIFLGPSILMLALGAPLVSAMPGLVAGGFLLPMSFALRQIRRDWQALSPRVLFSAMTRCGLRYAGVVGLFWLLFVPAVIALCFAAGSQLYLQIALVGPLTVVPVLMTARLLGTFVDSHSSELGVLLLGERSLHAPQKSAAVATVAATTKTATAKPQAGRRPQPAPAAPVRAAPATGAGAPTTRATAARRPASQAPRAAAARPAAPAPATSSAAPQPKPAARKPAAPPAPPRPQQAPAKGAPAGRPAAQPQPQPQRAAPAKAGPRPARTQLPDLRRFPGATVVQGDQRAELGASARTR